jgi:hypothetical protein
MMPMLLRPNSSSVDMRAAVFKLLNASPSLPARCQHEAHAGSFFRKATLRAIFSGAVSQPIVGCAQRIPIARLVRFLLFNLGKPLRAAALLA